MFTRCIACHTVHPVNAALLAQGAGKYRCGKCSKLNDALQTLFDDWPDAGTAPPKTGTVPRLGIEIDLKATSEDRVFPSEDSEGFQTGGKSRNITRMVWVSVAAVLIMITAFNGVHFFREPLMQNPQIQRGLVEAGLQDEVTAPEIEDLGLIELVSSEMRSHPDQSGALRLGAILTNRASVQQPYPGLEVILLDSLGQPLASRVFQPTDYLAGDANIARGMAPSAYLPISLDLSDPGQKAVGFELKIH